MARNESKRLDDLEKAILPPEDEPLIIVDWGDDYLIIDGAQISREEFGRRYPDCVTVTWPEDEDNNIVRLGIDLGAV